LGGCKAYLRLRIRLQDDPADMKFYYPYQVAQDYGRLGEKDATFTWLNRCYDEGAGMNFVKFDPAFDKVRSDPRFSELIRRMGFPN
jgi:hypothetical protein